MKLLYLYESLNINVIRQLKIISTELDIPEEKLVASINEIDPSNKYAEWVLRQIKYKNVRVPEDNYRVKEVISQFKQYQSRLQQKDLNQYKTIHDVENAIEQFVGTGSKRGGAFQVNPETLEGVKLVSQDGDYKLWEVSDPKGDTSGAESLAAMGLGTKWCTRKDYGKQEPESFDDGDFCQAYRYMADYGIIYIISKDNKPIIQFTPDFSQIKDAADQDVNLSQFTSLLTPIEDKIINDLIKTQTQEKPRGFSIEVLQDIINTPQVDYLALIINYVKATNKRFKRVEPYIRKNLEWFDDYAQAVKTSRMYNS